MTERHGRCMCGAVHFTVTGEPLAARICWCSDCQHISANGTANMMIPTEALQVSGTVAEYTRTAASGNQIVHQFCANCGTQLFGRSAARPQFRVVRVGNLDAPSSVRPTSNIWSSSAPSWACLDPALERIDSQPSPPPAAVKA